MCIFFPRRLEWAVIVLIALPFVYLPSTKSWNMEYVKDPEKLETLYMVLNPDVNSSIVPVWEEMEGITADELRIVCDSMVRDVYPNCTFVDYVKEPLDSQEGNVSRRFLRAEMLMLEDTVITIPVVKCVFRHATFYITRAGSDSVFEVRRDGQLFRLNSGLFKIFFKERK